MFCSHDDKTTLSCCLHFLWNLHKPLPSDCSPLINFKVVVYLRVGFQWTDQRLLNKLLDTRACFHLALFDGLIRLYLKCCFFLKHIACFTFALSFVLNWLEVFKNILFPTVFNIGSCISLREVLGSSKFLETSRMCQTTSLSHRVSR